MDAEWYLHFGGKAEREGCIEVSMVHGFRLRMSLPVMDMNTPIGQAGALFNASIVLHLVTIWRHRRREINPPCKEIECTTAGPTDDAGVEFVAPTEMCVDTDERLGMRREDSTMSLGFSRSRSFADWHTESIDPNDFCAAGQFAWRFTR